MPLFYSKKRNLSVSVPDKNGFTFFQQQRDKIDFCGYAYPVKKADAMMVRDPVQRIISGWRSRIILDNGLNKKATTWLSRVKGIGINEMDQVTLSDILDAVEISIQHPDRRKCPVLDSHFSPQVFHLDELPERFYDLRYDHDFIDYLGLDITRKMNQTDHKFPQYIPSEDEMSRIKALYAEDFLLYERYLQFRAERLDRDCIL